MKKITTKIMTVIFAKKTRFYQDTFIVEITKVFANYNFMFHFAM